MAQDAAPDGQVPDGQEVMARLLSTLLRGLRVLEFIGRHLDPERVDELVAAVGTPDVELRAALVAYEAMQASDADEPGIGRQLASAARVALTCFEGLRAAASAQDVRGAYRALRREAEALEALFALSGTLAAVDAFFRETGPAVADAAYQSSRDDAGQVGLMHAANDIRQRGGFSLYVPGTYRAEDAHGLVVALHGGSGHGRRFVWNWLRTARSRGLIVVCPTSLGATWSLAGADVDSANLDHILDFVRARWNIDSSRLLLTGMSDGGTFTLLSGLREGSPFTHLAPCAAGFHPLMAQAAAQDRLRGLPIYLLHGALDWMFPVELAQATQHMLTRVGASVTYREVDDLAHVYPRDENPALVDWFLRKTG